MPTGRWLHTSARVASNHLFAQAIVLTVAAIVVIIVIAAIAAVV